MSHECDLVDRVVTDLDKERLLDALQKMILIRNFEVMGESAYQMGKIGGFYHSYMGEEAIQTAAVAALGTEHWYTASYRSHALALLLGISPNELMAELYGKVTGNVKGRGGSMHLSAEHMLGGFAIVGSHIPIATGAAFQLKYDGIENRLSLCFLGDGAVAQGAFHESLNLASLWDLPVMYVIENNKWGMGTAVDRALCMSHNLGKDNAACYQMECVTLDGMDFFSCYAGFKDALRSVFEKKRPILIEAVTERFRGHSIADPALYRTKEDLEKIMQRDPIILFKRSLKELGFADDKDFEEMDRKSKEIVRDAMRFADASAFPDVDGMTEGVYV